MTTQYRKHFLAKHADEWEALCKEKGIERRLPKANLADEVDMSVRESYSLSAFVERLTRWVVVDDQVSNFLFLYI